METKPSKAFGSIRQGLNEALEFAVGSESKAVVRKLTGDETRAPLETDFERKDENVETPKEASKLNTSNPL